MKSSHTDNASADEDVPVSAADARARVMAVLKARERGPGGPAVGETALADVLLVTSELVTNAIRHGGGLTRFAAEVTGGGLLLTVGDASDALPVSVPGREGFGAGGYGWPLVHRLAADVSVTRLRTGGKRIRALVPLG
ncbi:ATP-binding protein [Streptomyces sp. TRM 70351]|uniref:ATP-binding protein n=1 Tax=Streptomyces sp. TRM 70351 TaxID=3116552 RepID=UPI002E7B2C8B|nr:ATP-binding protein [Streptomyces sp. TRM 70351]MEE1930498.1 ATP-binding protein [Streptomyces sp. TRM 70351]